MLKFRNFTGIQAKQQPSICANPPSRATRRIMGEDLRTWFDAGILRALGRLRVATRRPMGGPFRANRRARRTGASVEFAEHRTYAPGDDPRMLDWNAYGRLDRLYTRLFHDEEDMHVCILVDCSASMRMALVDGVEKLALARRLAAALGHVALAGQLQVSVGFFADTLARFSEPMRGRSRFHRLLDWLDRIPPAGDGTSFSAALDAVAAASPRRSLIVVISDFLDPQGFEQPLRRLLYRRCDVAMVELFEPFNLDSLPPGSLLLVDAETGEEIILDSGIEARRTLAAHIEARTETTRNWARQRGIPLARVDASLNDEAAIRTLIEAGVLSQ